MVNKGKGPSGPKKPGASNASNNENESREETHEERMARAFKYNRYNWTEGMVMPKSAHPLLQASWEDIVRVSAQLISPFEVGKAAAEELRRRGLPVPGEDGKGNAKKTGPARSSNSKRQTGRGKQPSYPARFSATPGRRNDKNDKRSNEPQSRRTSLPRLSPAGSMPYSPTRDRNPSGRRPADNTPIRRLDMLKCDHYEATANGITVHVEAGVMACVEYRGYSELNVFAIHDLPNSPCIDDILVIICKTSVTFARIPGHLNPHHTLVNCRQLTGALTPFLDYSEPVTVYALCPRTPHGEPWYTTENKLERLNAVYGHMQEFAKNIGSFLFESYFPTLPTDFLDCNITVGPVLGGDVDFSSGELGEEEPSGTETIGSSFDQNRDFGFGGQTDTTMYGDDSATNNFASDFDDTNVWSSLGMTQKDITLGAGSAIYDTFHNENSDFMQLDTQNYNYNQNQNPSGLSAFDQSYAEELGFIDPSTIRSQFTQNQQAQSQSTTNPFAQNTTTSTGGYPSAFSAPTMNTNTNSSSMRNPQQQTKRARKKVTFNLDSIGLIGSGFDHKPHVARRPRLIVRDRCGERIL